MTKIQWTNETWNPIIGCNKVSEGCTNCYAEKMAFRLANMEWNDDGRELNYCKVIDPDTKQWNRKTHFVEEALTKPLKWIKPKMIFVVSMGDLFHESASFKWIDSVFSVMSDYDHHTYQILTKRPQRVLDYFSWKWEQTPFPWFPKNNIWFGVSCENQKTADERIPLLLKIPGHIRYLSCEPLLGDLNLDKYLIKNSNDVRIGKPIDWIILGGESGHKARPMNPEWVYNIMDQCKFYDIPFFFKQWGEWHESDLQDNNGKYRTHLFSNGKLMYKIGKKKAGRLICGKEYNEFPNINI